MTRRTRPQDARDLRKEKGNEPRYRAVFDKLNDIQTKTVYDLSYWLALPRWAKRGEFERQLDTVYALGKVRGRRTGGRTPQADGTGPAVPPTSNTGGKSETVALPVETQRTDLQTVTLVLENGKIKEVTTRAHGWGDDLAHVDQVSFTVHDSTCHVIAGRRLVADDEFVMAMSAKLEAIFGFGVSHKRPKGMNFYDATWVLGQEDVCYGNLSYGGQRDTMLVQLTGVGCMAAFEGWEKRLYDFLENEAQNPRLTRVDCAYDDYDGEYSVDQAYADTKAGLFNTGGRNPFVEKRSDWDNPDGSGRTLYVGKRANGKFCRVYEKGKEQGSPLSPWTRVEVEFKAVDRIIPHDILLNAGSYLAGAYPAFDRFKGKTTPARIQTQVKEADHAIDHYIYYGAIQVGRLINYLREVAHWDEQTIVSMLSRPDAGFPQRLKLSNLCCDFGNREFIHHYPKSHYDRDEFARDDDTVLTYPPMTTEQAREACRVSRH